MTINQNWISLGNQQPTQAPHSLKTLPQELSELAAYLDAIKSKVGAIGNITNGAIQDEPPPPSTKTPVPMDVRALLSICTNKAQVIDVMLTSIAVHFVG
jgi:hypothetical protein